MANNPSYRGLETAIVGRLSNPPKKKPVAKPKPVERPVKTQVARY